MVTNYACPQCKNRVSFNAPVGTWLSLVEHRVRDAGVAGSNPVVPTTASHVSLLDKPRKIFKRAVICDLGLCGKTAGRELPHSQMIGDTLAADPFPGTRVVCTIACFEILFSVAFHDIFLLACRTGIPDARSDMNGRRVYLHLQGWSNFS